MKNKGILQFGSLGCAGFAAYLLRTRIEEKNLFSDAIKKYVGMPLNRTFSDATRIISDTLPVLIKDLTKHEKGRVSDIMKYGFPSVDNVHSLDDYVLAYDNRTRVAAWVFEHLTADSVRKRHDVDRSDSHFVEDKSIHEYFRAKNSDYKRSGFDRGHLAAAGNHQNSQKILDQTFLLSNMAPQVGPGFNRDAWRELETHVRELTDVYPDVYVCTGPLYLPKKKKKGKLYIKYEVIGDTQVAVPTHFFKVVLMEDKDRKLYMEAYIMPNKEIPDNTPLETFMVPPEEVERASGLLIFDKISKKNIKINGGKRGYSLLSIEPFNVNPNAEE